VILGSSGGALPSAGARFRRESALTSATGGSLYRGEWGAASLSAPDTVANDGASGSWLAFCGNPFWRPAADASAAQVGGRATQLLSALAAHGTGALADVDGQFAIAWWDARSATLRLIRDRFGAEPLHYGHAGRGIVFGSRAEDVARALPSKPSVSPQGLAEYLTYCYLPGNATLFEGVLRVPAGGVVSVTDERAPVVTSWYRLSYADPWDPDEQAITRRYRELLEESVVARLDGSRLGVFLSGGMDSSSVLTFARRHRADGIDTFSFRCAGAGFDESMFARELADELHSNHSEVEYGEAEALTILDAVEAMDSPFCDIGIEIGTWLLARRAAGHVDYLLTGDGGDELWASHPVYAAQRLMGWYDAVPLPTPVRRAIAGTLNLMKDSEHKRGLAVTLKRILPPADVSPALGHFRWRLYQTPTTLPRLVTPELREALRGCDPLRPVLESYEGYDGPDDGMSKWLYSDYRTASSFYFNRLLLARHFGLEVRTPFYDRKLVEFGARIPARLKLEGIERTKRLFRMAMEGVLPDVINHRKDKLGHSVPFKNWLRSDGALNQAVTETLESERFRSRGLFAPAAVERLVAEHRARRHNHSHRIWALYVLEHWLRHKLD
jgi:asparagine synthase (glutamine-hydrolysing)